VGEVLGYQRGFNPRALVAAWLRSPTHSHVLLGSRYAHAGVGVVRGTPAGGRGLTFVVDFGRR
jgi:uncharacterized protein YkwD